jgi:hypothetical protein
MNITKAYTKKPDLECWGVTAGSHIKRTLDSSPCFKRHDPAKRNMRANLLQNSSVYSM